MNYINNPLNMCCCGFTEMDNIRVERRTVLVDAVSNKVCELGDVTLRITPRRTPRGLRTTALCPSLRSKIACFRFRRRGHEDQGAFEPFPPDVRRAGGGRLTHGEGKDLHPHIERAGAA